MSEVQRLPDLPKPWDTVTDYTRDENGVDVPAFSAEQMRQYARIAIGQYTDQRITQMEADHARRVEELEAKVATYRAALSAAEHDMYAHRQKALAAEADAGRLRADATEAVEGLIALLKTAAVFGDFDGVNHNGRPVAEVISELLAAESIAELRAALAAGVGGDS